MLVWKGVATAGALAVVAAAGWARGDAGVTADAGAPRFLPPDRPLMLDDATTAPAPAKKPLMALLAGTPLGPALDKANINLYGFIDAGVTASFNPPPGSLIAGNVFNPNQGRLKVDQIDYNIERTVDAAAAAKNHTFDVGGHIEFQYGYDTRFYHSNGLFSYYNDNGSPLARTHPEMQMDLTQAYIDLALPVGNGLMLRAGKFVTPLGYEVINGPSNPFYSHSYLFGYAIPFTHTGLLGTYVLNDNWTVQAGLTRGWNQSTDDNNGAAEFLGSVTWTPDASNIANQVIFSMTEGPEAAKDNHDYWTVGDLIIKHAINKQLSVALNADYGDAPHAIAFTNKSAQWGGIALYGSYVFSDYITFNGRAEWYDDYNGFTLGAVPYLSVYELTLGATVTPLPHNDILQNLKIRPEIRGDYASGRAFNGGNDYYQFQVAVDAYFTF